MNNFDAFIESIKFQVENLIYSPINDQTRNLINSILSRNFEESKASGEILMPFDGIQVIQGSSYFIEHIVQIRWGTEFFPGPRFCRHPGDCTPLGFFGDYDLYVCAQNQFSPTLVARYGNGLADYSTFNPHIQGPVNAEVHGEHFVEALFRALSINYDFGTLYD